MTAVPSIAGQPIDWPISSSLNITEMRNLENPEIWFFAKMAQKTTFGSGFHFTFELRVPDLIEKDINIDEVCRRLFEIFDGKI